MLSLYCRSGRAGCERQNTLQLNTLQPNKKKNKKEVSKMKYVQEARSAEHGTARVPLYDENDNIINKISTVDQGSFLKFLENSKTTDYSDLSGTTVKVVVSIDKNGVVDTTTDIVEILRTQGNYVVVLRNDTAYSIYSGVAKFYKIN